MVCRNHRGWPCRLDRRKIMKSDMGLIMNIILGIVGALVANWLLMLIVGSTLGGWFGQLVVGIIGACLLIWVTRLVRGKT